MVVDPSVLPNSPGCYLFKDKRGGILYIGKAKNLKSRVRSYFSGVDDPKTAELVTNIHDVEVILTDTEPESLLLEARLIRQHKPKYNIRLKDSRRYAYIEVTDEEYPRIRTVRSKKGKGKMFGPFTDGLARVGTVKTLNEVFQLRVCKTMPDKVCLYYHIGRCCGPCEGHVSREEYQSRVNQASQYLAGDTKDLRIHLKQEMEQAALKQHFEVAKQKRDQLFAIERLNQRQKVDLDVRYNQDVIAYAKGSDQVVVTIFTLEKGSITAKEDFALDIAFESGDKLITQFVQQYYADHTLPGEIIVEAFDDDSLPVLESAFSTESKVRILIPQRGVKRELVAMAKKNAQYALFGKDQTLVALQKALRLPEAPTVIECFDISTLQGKHTVASMVCFRDGNPDTDNYRRFKMKWVQGQDDFASMREVVRRRYFGQIERGEPLPDLVMIDGGRGQLNAAIAALRSLSIKIPIIALAKKEEEIYLPGLPHPLRLDKRREEIRLLQRIRDEAHRFAITYHRLLRDKKSLE